MRLAASNLRQQGFSYVEVLLSVVLLAVLLVPALQALQPGLMAGEGVISPQGGTPAIARQLKLTDKMEQVLAKPFADLYAETYLPGANTTTSTSDTLSDDASALDRRMVVLYRYNPSATPPALSTADTGVVFVRVYYYSDSSSSLSTLVSKWW